VQYVCAWHRCGVPAKAKNIKTTTGIKEKELKWRGDFMQKINSEAIKKMWLYPQKQIQNAALKYGQKQMAVGRTTV
jgi:hypothetical protein